MNAPMAAPRKLPPALAANLWRKGQSGNPGGTGGAVRAAQRLARDASPMVMARLIELTMSSQEKVALVACQAVLDRGLGRTSKDPPRIEPERDIEQARLDLRTVMKTCSYDELELLKSIFGRLSNLRRTPDATE